MDQHLSSLKRRYAVEPDNELAHQIAQAVMRSEPIENLTFEQKVDRYNAVTRSMEGELAGAIGEEIQKLVLKDEEIEGIRWTQYTPYFNDGDACIFGVMDAYVKIKGRDEEAGDYGDGFLSPWDVDGRTYNSTLRQYEYNNSPEQQALYDKIKSVTDFVGKIPESLMLAAFGDHRRITIDADGIHNEHYDHD